ncbi:hypothetical protein F5Y13DRAFT_150869 [Hypoxylon sp. FL1857]|nr:hypothetical protein F5Y13DRAFT_150869 [Hypoxylon sp. FL1857]
MAPQEIRGYYFDAEKRRFFKVEHSQTAPSNAAWSSDKVKKRKIEDEAAAAQLRRVSLNKSRITRSKALNAPLMGGFLAREYGQHIRDLRDIRPASFAQGFARKGKRLLSHILPAAINIKHMTVVSKHPEQTFCTAYTSCDSNLILTAPIPRDDKTGHVDQRLIFESSCNTRLGCLCPRPEYNVTLISDIKYSQKAGLVLVASEDSGTPGRPLSTIAPKRLRHGAMHTTQDSFQEYRDADRRKYTSSTVCAAPSTSSLICLVGTNIGVAQFDQNCQMRLYSPLSWRRKPYVPDSFRDVFSIDFHTNNPNIMFFGGRPGKLVIGDIRQEVGRWDNMHLNNSIAHVKSVSEHQVLVAGLRNKLSIFDLRYCDLSQVRDRDNPKIERRATPVVTMPDYKNAAHFDVGLDYDPDSGVVAAAHDDGKVALYSVRSGCRLPSRDIDKIYSEFGPIHRLQFETFDGDNTASLFTGEKSNVCVYSFGVEHPDDEA